MAEFAQSPASRAALHDAARDYLAIRPDRAVSTGRALFSKPQLAERLAGTSDHKSKAYKSALRSVERWETAGAQKRKPSKASQEKLAQALQNDPKFIRSRLNTGERPPLTIRLDAHIEVGADPKYGRDRSGIVVHFRQEDAAKLLSEALTDPDEAWQTFFDVYVLPASTVENVHIELE